MASINYTLGRFTGIGSVAHKPARYMSLPETNYMAQTEPSVELMQGLTTVYIHQ